jgi:non-ribosomal peptide synthetase component F
MAVKVRTLTGEEAQELTRLAHTRTAPHRLVRHFQTLLEGVVANPEQRISMLPLLTAAKRQRLLIEWNDTHAYYPEDSCLQQLVEAQVERTPDAVAVMFEDERLTYRELNAQANQLAHHLQALGVGPEVCIGIGMERPVELVVGL